MKTQEQALLIITRSVALLFLGLGFWLMIQPQVVETFYPMTLNAPMAFSEIRAIFGGMMIGIGSAVLLLDIVFQRPRNAAMVLATIAAGLVLARFVGWGAEGFPTGPVLTESIFEIVLFSLLVVLGAFRRAV